MPRLGNKSRNAGFGMIEVAVAFLLLSLGLGVLLGGLTVGLRSTDRAANAGLALLYAESLMAETQAGVLQAGEITGRTDSGYVWRRVISPLPVSPPMLMTPFKVSVSVTPPDNGAPVRLVTLLLSHKSLLRDE